MTDVKNKVVEDLRRQIDSLDNQVHDLLMKRAELVIDIGAAKRKNNVQVVQPDREAVMIRRLLKRHDGMLPKEAVVRIWRELVGAVSLLQTGLKVVVYVPDDSSGLIYWDMAKDYFSSVLPMQKNMNALGALAMVREGEATFAVLPWPRDEESNAWWAFLMQETGDDAMRVMARLPFGDRTAQDANPEHQAVVIARVKFETSGADRSFIALDLDHSISRARIIDKAKAIGLTPRSLCSAPYGDRANTRHLLEVEEYVAASDAKLDGILKALESPQGRCVSLGGYPVPPVYDDKVGKGAAEAEQIKLKANQ